MFVATATEITFQAPLGAKAAPLQFDKMPLLRSLPAFLNPTSSTNIPLLRSYKQNLEFRRGLLYMEPYF